MIIRREKESTYTIIYTLRLEFNLASFTIDTGNSFVILDLSKPVEYIKDGLEFDKLFGLKDEVTE